MIAYIIGEAAEIGENQIVLEQNCMGYNIFVPTTVTNTVRSGETIKVYTYLNVKEDAIQLFGFLTRDDLNIFKLLLGVNGIGPKAALGVLSALTADELRFAVLADDAQTIAKAPGVGKKTAQKLILELKDKLNLEDVFEQKLTNKGQADAGSAVLDHEAKQEAVEALVALGYASSDALRAVRKVDGVEAMSVESILKAALKNM